MKLFTTTSSAKYKNAVKYTPTPTHAYVACTGKIATSRLNVYIEDLDVDGRIILDSIVTNRLAGFKLCLTVSEWGSETRCCGNGNEPCGS
jgi:hypothetical protein